MVLLVSKRFFSFFLVGLFLVSFLVVVLPVGAVDWLSGWEYRKEIVFSSVEVEGVQLNFNVTFDELNGHCQVDFGDLRFYYVNGTQAGAWCEQYVVSGFCEVWLKSDGGDSVYVYYGNSDVESDWAGSEDVFVDVVGGVVLGLPMNEATAEENCIDYSGNGNDGVPTGTTVVEGKFTGRNGRLFNGVGDFILVDDAEVLKPTSAISISAFVKPTGVSGEKCIANKNYEFAWEFSKLNTNLKVNCNINGTYRSNYLSSGQGLVAGNFSHVVWTFDSTTGSSYIDASQKQTRSDINGALGSNAMKLCIGARDLGSNLYFDGVISDFIMFNIALSQPQITNLASNFGDVTLEEGSCLVRVWVDVMPSVEFGGEVVSNQVLQENLDFVYLLALLGVVCALGGLCFVLMR